MKQVYIGATDVAGAIEEIFNLIQRNLSNDTSSNIYVDGWAGFGAAAVLRSIAQALPSMKDPPPVLCFGRIIYIDCSRWTSKRGMQKRIAEELRLDHKTMSMFDEVDEEDDFNGVDHGSRDPVRSVAVVIDRTLREGRFMMIFINGSGDEVLLGRLGIPENSDCMILWTFSTRCVTMGSYEAYKIAEKLRYTDVLVYCNRTAQRLSSSQFMALLSEEAATIVSRHPCLQGVDLTTVVDCCLYGLHLHHSFHGTTGFVWPAHSSNYWICDGIMQQGQREREISNALHPEIIFECDASVLDGVFKKLKDDPKTPFLVIKDSDDDIYEERRPIYYRWISIRVKNKELHEGMQNILERASSVFLALETTDRPYRLPNGIFKLCNNLGVLVLSCCGFSFESPPFLHCHALRFLGLDHCTDNNNSNAVEHQGCACATRWAFLQSLCVLDLYYTDWIELLSEEKMELMANIIELNIEGIKCSHLLRSWLQKRLPHLRRLRIIKPVYDNNEAETMSSDINNSFLMDNTTSLEILDMSGNNRGMRKLPASMSEAGHLQLLILDGCDGLEEVVLSGNKSIMSFSFDGYGPSASHRTSTIELPPVISRPPKPPLDAEKQSVIVKTFKVSLKGCTRLDNLFLRGLPNLEELDLSGCSIKVLDFGAMVLDVPLLKRLFLLGCENLRAIKWGSYKEQLKLLELICIDTRPRVGCARPTSLCQQESVKLQVHAIFTDARLARSLWAPIDSTPSDACYFNISITSSATCMETIQLEETTNKKKVTGSVDHPRHCDIAARDMYRDVFTKVGNGPTPIQAFPQGPIGQLDCHIEIGDGSHSIPSEVEADPGANLASLMRWRTQSLHVHDVSTYSNTMHGQWDSLRWCRVERCPNLRAVFPPRAMDYWGKLETIWASDLLMARCVWSRGVFDSYHFRSLRHLHLRCCPSLQFGLAMDTRPSLPSLETLHIIHCGNLRHIFVAGDEKYRYTSVEFPKLISIHLHDLPALQQIWEATKMLAPALETIRIRGCWSLRRLPALKGRESEMRRPTVEMMEKDVWDGLEWDGVDAGHDPSLYEAPVHSRYYKRHMLRTTVLR